MVVQRDYPSKHRVKTAISLLVLVLATACGSQPLPSTTGIGEGLLVYTPREANSFKITDGLTVAVENRSEHEIALLPENAVTLFERNGEGWVKVGNVVANSIPHKIVLSPRDAIERNATTIWSIPDVPATRPATIRVEILGIDLVTNEEVRGSTEATLMP